LKIIIVIEKKNQKKIERLDWQIKLHLNFICLVKCFCKDRWRILDIHAVFVRRSHTGFFKRWESRRQQVTCSSILSRGIVFPFSGTNFLRDRHRDARYRMSQPSLGTLTLPHTNFSYSICWPFWDHLFFHFVFFYAFLLSIFQQ